MGAEPDHVQMTILEHLEELRTRIFRAILSIVAGIAIGWSFRDATWAWLVRPLEIASFCHARACRTPQFFWYMAHPAAFRGEYLRLPDNLRQHLHTAAPTDGFAVNFKLAAVSGLLIALPMIFYQLWSFVAPGLYPREKRLVLPFVVFSTLFFVMGALFGYYFVFPIGYEWFLGFSGSIGGTGTEIRPMIMAPEYLDFTSQMLLAFGVVFEMPLFIFFLALAGVVTSKQLFGFGRYFTVIAFVLAAVLTPSTDVYSQVMLGAPLVLLYFLAAALAGIFGPKEARGFRSGIPGKK